ncbi:MAG: hypothetical protein DMG01_20020, partial [Acidobacteria bacterium]
LEWVRQVAPVPVAANLVRSRDGIRFVDADYADAHPESWLQLFQTAIEANAAVTDGTLAWIQQRVERHRPEEFFPRPVNRAALLAFLRPRAGLYARLSEMHDCGLLGRMFPEFQAIFCRLLRDVWAARTIAAITDPAVIDRGASDRSRLDEAEQFLLRLRSILHVEHKRNNNVLSHENQEQAARLMRYAGAPRQQVERLMGDYFRHARAV